MIAYFKQFKDFLAWWHYHCEAMFKQDSGIIHRKTIALDSAGMSREQSFIQSKQFSLRHSPLYLLLILSAHALIFLCLLFQRHSIKRSLLAKVRKKTETPNFSVGISAFT